MKHFKTTYDETQKMWCGPEMPRDYPADYSIGRAALEAMEKADEKIGQICSNNGKEYKYKDLASFTKSVAKHFTKLGMQQCDVIGICASNSDYLAPLFFGAMLRGFIISPLHVSYDNDSIKHTCTMAKPKLMFCDGGVYERVKGVLLECGLNIKIYTMTDHIDGVPTIEEFLKESVENGDLSFEPLKNGGSQTAVILYSSGTTGIPKGATFSHEDWLTNRFLDLEPKDRLFNFMQIHWYTGVYALIKGTLSGLTRVISIDDFSPENLLNIVEKYKVTKLLTPTSQMALTLACPQIETADLSSIRTYGLAGSALPYALVQQIKPYLPNAKIYNAYGMSEARQVIAAGELCNKSGFIGQLASNCMCKIIADNGQRLGPNEIGEPCYKVSFKWNGYFDNPKATAAAYDSEGWIVSGDLGYFDEEGNLFIVDRKKDIIKYNFFVSFPTEIESVIYELPDVLEVCCFGLPDVMSIELPAAAVVKRENSDLDEAKICEHVAKRMADHKHLRGGVYFMNQLPKTSTGKPLRREVKQICEKLRQALL